MHEREHRILAFWKERGIFEKSLNKNSPKGNFVFYDGPPYATGLPHAGHVLPTTLKDVIPRYKTMRGYHVPRRWGWDCHGLPIENLVEKEMGLKSKKDIEEVGVDVFNKAARGSVLRYADEWKQIIPRLGRWIDMDNDYQTMDASYMESVMWSFTELNRKGLVYEDYKVMPFCPRCGTTLSNFEVAQGYKDITDISAYVKFELENEVEVMGNSPTYVLAWTTTPWTLPGNVALAVNPELSYSKVKTEEGNFWIATNLVPKVFEGKEFSVTEEMKGSALVGKSYKPVFSYYSNEGTLPAEHESRRANAWKIYAGDFVTAEDGTGVVHIAPAYGEDDMILSRKVNLPVIHHVGSDGLFIASVTDFAGQAAKPIEDHQKGDIEIIKYLAHPQKDRPGNVALFKKEKYIHSYPHCWRCSTPLLNFATSSWFIKVTALKDRLVEENKKITWTPKEVGEGRFGNWLEGARDWAVSRSRYWGTAIPVWRAERSGKTEFIGSVHELKTKIKQMHGNGNTFMLVRHGECESNVKDVISSRNLEEYGLTEKGVAQVDEAALKLKREAEEGKEITIIYSSDLRRTRETAEIIAAKIGYDKTRIVYDARLREINGGDFDGSSWATRGVYFKDMNDRIFKRVPNGESVADIKKRTSEFLYDIDALHKGARILVVTHGLVIRMALQTAGGRNARDLVRSGWTDISDPNASIHHIDFVPLPHNEDYELDLHRPYIDAVTWENAEGETMRRVPEVFDVWYDSGSMSFAQAHYPFESEELLLAKNSTMFPADFIAEGLDQTRGWFYSLLISGVGLFDRASYKNVVVNGLILAEDGRKMSKSLKNYPDLMPVVEKYGADSLRYFFMASPAVRGEEVAFSEKALDEVNKKLFNRLENVYTFYKTYADAKSGIENDNGESKNILDRWIVSRLNALLKDVTVHLDLYQLDKAARPIADFIDDLSTWYLRRSRERFKGDDVADKNAALATTKHVLLELSKIMAPFTPFIAEDMYQRMANLSKCESVHLDEWSEVGSVDERLIEEMVFARKLVETGLGLRAKAGIKVRQPLASFTYGKEEVEKTEYGNENKIITIRPELQRIVADELNVKSVIEGGLGVTTLLDTVITPELKNEGVVREFTRGVQEIRKEMGLAVTDVISLALSTDEETKELIISYKETVMKAVSAKTLEFALIEDGREIKIEDVTLIVKVEKAEML